MAEYNYITRSQAKEKLKQLSGDLLAVFWTDSEWNSILEEALFTFGALSSFWKDDIQINTEDGKRIYDIFIDNTAEKSTAPSLTYGKVVEWLNRDLIEELSTASPTSEFLSLTTLLNLIEAGYNAFQAETNLIVSQHELPVIAQNNIVNLEDHTISIIRLVYEDSEGEETILKFVDEQEIAYFDKDALTEEGTPVYYSTTYSSPKDIRLYPIPANSGNLKVLSIDGRDTSITLDEDIVINLPNNLVPYLKYYVLISIFSKDGIFNEPARAAYFGKRWKEGITVAKQYSSVLIAKGNGLAIDTDSLNKMDDYITPTVSSDPPTILGFAGFNIFQVDNIPNNNINSILITVNQNASIPVDDNSKINVELDYENPILNYCIHLAQIKTGIAEIATTNNYYEDFVRTAINHNKRLQRRGISYETLVGRTKKEEREIKKLAEQEA